MKRKKKTQAKRVARKPTRKKRAEVLTIDLDQFYKLANQVQVTREDVNFAVELDDASMIDNLLKDLELPFVRTDKKSYTKYSVSPGKERLIEDDEEEVIDDFPDEIAEDGQIFF